MNKILVETISPSEYKKLHNVSTVFYGFHSTPFGEIIIGITHNSICYLNFVLKDKQTSINELSKFWNKSLIKEDESLTKKYFDIIFNNLDSQIKVLFKGTQFQIQVWKSLLRIPLGQLSTYKKIAESINSNALRAVGTAIGHNPIAYVVPCHRVINSNGKLGNYGGGKERKKQIIQFEGANISFQ